MSNETIYWGILCRQCSELVAFGAPSHQHFEVESECARPGAIRCANGHNYIYFPRDFRFFTSAVAIPEAVMQRNLEAHSAINSIVGARTNHGEPERWRPEEVEDSSGSWESRRLRSQSPQAMGPTRKQRRRILW